MKRVLFFALISIVLVATVFASEPEYLIVDCIGKPGGTLYMAAVGDPPTFNAAISVSTSYVTAGSTPRFSFQISTRCPQDRFLPKSGGSQKTV